MSDAGKRETNVGQTAVLVEDVCKDYMRWSPLKRWKPIREARSALRNVSLRVEPGEMLGLLGPNGAGKTTLLKIIAALLYPTSGRVEVHGHSVFESNSRGRGLIGLVTCDERSFYWRLTGRQNLRFFAALYGLSKGQFVTRSESLLETTGLSRAADLPYHTYSAGMKQKLAIIRGLLSEPRLVLYDEPTRSLDPLSTQNVRAWIISKRAAAPEQTHIIATNQLEEAEQLCDRVVIINRGVLIAQGTIDEIRQRWQQREYEVHHVTYRGADLNGVVQVDPKAGFMAVDQEAAEGDEVTLRLSVARDSDALSRFLRLVLENSGTVVRCETERVTFDEVFCSLVLGDQEDGNAVIGTEAQQ
ncbi:MAG: ABC transporter ATP-binding protein [bacterium]|nr:ABC transporter ATP-binding protein [bacterium]